MYLLPGYGRIIVTLGGMGTAALRVNPIRCCSEASAAPEKPPLNDHRHRRLAPALMILFRHLVAVQATGPETVVLL
jgi:hypothetical protein